jgi:5-methylcytosine-specific restriction endonuclease McrA
MEDAQVLVLDKSYRPLQVVHWTAAITMLFTSKAEVVAEYDGFVRSALLVLKMPAVIRLLNVFRRKSKKVKFSRVNIYARDNYECQYCGARKRMGELTYDHVIPRSQGGKTDWTNIVSACTECNGKKANKTPEQARMKLRKQPVQPVKEPAVVLQLSRENVPDAWRDFLYWTGELEQG